MTTAPALRTQRLNSRQNVATEQVIAFQLRDEWFALPIFTVQRVIPLGEVYGDPNQSGISLTRYQDEEILVLDVAQLIFSEAEGSETPITSPPIDPPMRFLAILQLESQNLLGLPIDSPPEVRRIPKSSICEIPTTYVERGKVRCVSKMMIETEDSPPIFLLAPNQLLEGIDV